MARAQARPVSTAEAALATTFAYLVLLISLTGARIADQDTEAPPPAAADAPTFQLRLAALTEHTPLAARPAPPAASADQAAAGAGPADPNTTRPGAAPADRGATPADRGAAPADPGAAPAGQGAAPADRGAVPAGQGAAPAAGDGSAGAAGAGRAAPNPTCVGARTVPYSNATAPGIVEPLAFGPPVEPSGPLSAAAVNGVLIQRLCGGPATPGGAVRAPDRRLFAAIDAAVNGRDPNRPLTRAQWAAGVDRFVIRDGLFVDARVVTRTVPAGTPTYGMKVVSRAPGADPVVVRTRMARADTSRYLLLPVRSATGRVVTLTLRLRCGFQPLLRPRG